MTLNRRRFLAAVPTAFFLPRFAKAEGGGVSAVLNPFVEAGTLAGAVTLVANKDRQIARLEGLYRRAVERPGGTVFEDRAVIKDRHTIHLVRAGRDITTDLILVATGGRPSREIGAPGAR